MKVKKPVINLILSVIVHLILQVKYYSNFQVNMIPYWEEIFNALLMEVLLEIHINVQ